MLNKEEEGIDVIPLLRPTGVLSADESQCMASGLDLYFVLAGVLQEPTALLVLLSPRDFHQQRYN